MNAKATTALFFIASMSTPVFADNATWLNVGGISHHISTNWDQGARYNESNPGLGIEHEVGVINYMAGFYKNSIGNTSNYLVAEKIVYKRGIFGAGFLGGMVDGYHLNDGRPIPAAAVTATVERNRLGVRFMYMPGIRGQSAPVLSVQIRLRLSR